MGALFARLLCLAADPGEKVGESKWFGFTLEGVLKFRRGSCRPGVFSKGLGEKSWAVEPVNRPLFGVGAGGLGKGKRRAGRGELGKTLRAWVRRPGNSRTGRKYYFL